MSSLIVVSSARYSLVSSPLLLCTEGQSCIVWPQYLLKKGSFHSTRPSVAPTTVQNPDEKAMSGRGGPRPPPTTSSGAGGRPLRGGRTGHTGQANLLITTMKQIARFIGRTYTQGGDICLAMENLAVPTLEGPTAPTTTDALAMAIVWEEVKEFVKCMKKLEENVQLLWALLWGQASDAVRTKLEAQRDHEDMHQWSAGIELLNPIKDLLYNIQELKYIPLAIHLARRHFYSSFQQQHIDAAHYLETIQQSHRHSGVVWHLERTQAPCARSLNRMVLTHLPLMRMN